MGVKKYLNLKSLIIGSLLCIGLIVMYAKFIFSPQEYIQSIQMRALGTVFAAAKNTNAKEAQEIVDQLSFEKNNPIGIGSLNEVTG